MPEHSEASLKKLTVAQLKEILTKSGGSTAGKKADLISRILGSNEDDAAAAQPEATVDDPTDEVDDLTASVDDVVDAAADVATVASAAETAPESDAATPSATSAVKPIELTDDERRARRAAKFGTASLEDKKLLRAKRFGLPVADVDSGSQNGKRQGKGNAGKFTAKANATLSDEEIAKLKKRAEKFGVISNHLKVVQDKQAKAEENEKKRKRAEKFGTGNAKAAGTTSTELDAKKKARAERFGLAKGAAATGADAEKLAARAKRFAQK
eukprot:m.69322 g.69322  ORF g.69322 m.69322 type:complete len:269 (-) comp16025_c0_seq1:295-1101(-)